MKKGSAQQEVASKKSNATKTKKPRKTKTKNLKEE